MDFHFSFAQLQGDLGNMVVNHLVLADDIHGWSQHQRSSKMFEYLSWLCCWIWIFLLQHDNGCTFSQISMNNIQHHLLSRMVQVWSFDQVKYHDALLYLSQEDDKDTHRQIKSLYHGANMLRSIIAQCSTALKITLVPWVLQHFACQLCCKCIQSGTGCSKWGPRAYFTKPATLVLNFVLHGCQSLNDASVSELYGRYSLRKTLSVVFR